MKQIRYIIHVLTVLVLFLTWSETSYAYLDPGSGSYFFQLAIASLLGGLYIIKVFWNKIKSFFSNIFAKGKNE